MQAHRDTKIKKRFAICDLRLGCSPYWLMAIRYYSRRFIDSIGVHECLALLSISLIGLCSIDALGQDIHFSQFDQAPLFLNPALCSLTADSRATINYKDQWGSLGTPYQTFGFNGEKAFFKDPSNPGAWMGVGLSAFSDKSGDIELGNQQIALTISGIVPLDTRNFISAGIQGGYDQLSFNPAKLKWESQYNGFAFDPSLPGEVPNSSQSRYADFSAGINWAYGRDQQFITLSEPVKFDLGFAMYHLNAPEVSFYTPTNDQLYTKYVFHGSFILTMPDSRYQLMPSFMYLSQGPSTEFDIGTLFRYVVPDNVVFVGQSKGAAISAGLYLRTHDAAIIQAQLEFGNYGLGMSYDFTTAQLQTPTNARGGLELMLRYRGYNPFTRPQRAQL